ncbi:hypothetical protein L2E82_05659 [Cichorium intybus]|uniref:Uncharacterized protein n=1 Tax=Cichorium intybus TaxID=13427 RepID=A0ACB9H8E4_CICIN|nr:hypothetical protein L2E82_05659 [Cichorium intybus]
MVVKIFKAWLKKRKEMNKIASSVRYEKWCPWRITRTSSSSMHEDDEQDSIPRDVPKGHLVVYVGQNQSRFVINVKLLKNPSFNALLDQAQEEYDFTNDSRLYIPCDEDVFLKVASLPHYQKTTFCF